MGWTRNDVIHFLIGLILGPIGILILLLIIGHHCPNPRCKKRIKSGIKKCPYCNVELEWKYN